MLSLDRGASSHRRRQSSSGSKLPWLGGGLIALLVLTWLARILGFWQRFSGKDTLIVYVFRNTDPESVNNLNYFLQHGLTQGDGAHYIIALEPETEGDRIELPERLPANVQAVRPSSPCFEVGTVGWVLWSSGAVDPTAFRFVLWLDSSLRGPFLPVYLHGAVSWHQLLTSRLRGDVKLVGATISCDGLRVNPQHGLLVVPHVQMQMAATDQTGLKLLREAGTFTCTAKWLDHLRFGNIGASETVLQAGFNIDSLMLRYEGVDWRDRSKWSCNAYKDPLGKATYDGISVNPLEVMFVRVQHPLLVSGWDSARQAVKYDEWAAADRATPGAEAVCTNEYVQHAAQLLADAQARGRSCFDADFYISSAPVEFQGFTADKAYEHFMAFGLKEGRPYRFIC